MTAQRTYRDNQSVLDDGVDLVEVSLALWAAKWFILGVTVIFAVLGIFYSLSITPIYRAEVVLAPASGSQSAGFGNFGGLASLAGIRLDVNSDGTRALAILKSKNFIAEFIRDKDLLPILFPDEWDSENQRWILEERQAPRDVRDGVRVFMQNVRTVTEDPQTGLVTLGIEWRDPEGAAEWASELVERINDRMRQQDIERSQRKLDYLNDQLSQANLVELRLAISRVIEEQIGAMMLAQSQMEYAFEIVDPTVVPKQRIRPKRTLIVVLATFLGGFVAVLLALSRYAVQGLIERHRLRNSA